MKADEKGEQEQEYFDDRNRRFLILGYKEDYDPENEKKDILVLARPLEGGVLKIEFYANSYCSSSTAKNIARHFAYNGAKKREFKNDYEDGKKLRKVCEIEFPPNIVLEEAINENKEKKIIKDCLLKLYSTYPDHF